jgi:hypothetical protein
MLHTILVSTNVFGSIYPFFFAVTLLDIIHEVSFVLASVDMSILSIPVGHIILEFSFIYITFRMPKCALSVSFVEEPFALIMCTISPILHSIAMPYFIKPIISFAFPMIHLSI